MNRRTAPAEFIMIMLIVVLAGCKNNILDVESENDVSESATSVKVAEDTKELDVILHQPNTNPIVYMNTYEMAGLTMKVSSVTGKGCVLEFLYEENDVVGAGEIESGDCYLIEKNEEGKWKEFDMLGGISEMWLDIAWSVMHDESYTVDWTELYGILPSGKYRILKPVHCNHTIEGYETFLIGAEFIVNEEE